MIKKTVTLFLCIILSLCFTGCSNGEAKTSTEASNSLGNGYQAFFDDDAPIVKTEDGYYFFGNSSPNLLFYDNNTEKVVPVCNRINCDHNNIECDAYLSFFIQGSLSYYDNNLYLVGYSQDNNQVYTCSLYKVSLDGSVRERLFDFCDISDDSISIRFIINSGYAYYALESTASFLEKEKCELYRMGLDEGGKKELLYENEGLGAMIYRLRIFDDTLYFQSGAYADAEGNGYSGDLYAYDITQKTLSKVLEQVYRDYHVIENELYYDDIDNIKCYNLLTKETDVFFDEGFQYISWDGTYIYLDNCALFYDNEDYEKRIVQVFTKDKELIDEISIPNSASCLFGDETHMFSYIVEDYSGSISILDKKQIGTGTFSWTPLE